MIRASLKALSSYWGLKVAILCRLMKLNNLIVAMDSESGNILSQDFSSFEIAFPVGHFVSDTCSNNIVAVAEKGIYNWPSQFYNLEH